ncbi:MAG: hypothetical protein NTX95_11325 [Actinobacteria bacterium]|jgi:hypothetical protein|nr:hypothetical protein [Actinomycetota bacterium]
MGGPDLSNPLGMSWLQPLTEDERSRIVFSEAGEMLDDGDWYVDATSPKRGPVLALEGEFVPKQGLYIRRSKVGEDLWGRVTLAASGKL